MPGRFVSKNVIVTGAAGGLGNHICHAFASEGAMVHLFDRKITETESCADEIGRSGGQARAYRVDVTSEDDVEGAIAAVASTGRIDVLVNNAGIAIRNAATDLPLDDWNKVIAVNQTGVFLTSRAAARYMQRAGGGAIVNLASIMGLSGGGLYPNISYQTSKGAVVNMTRALAVEWAPAGIRVNAVAPTWVRTDLTRGLFDDPATLSRMLAVTPLGRLAEPSDVSPVILFLSSDGARLITGQTLPVDGGFLAI